MATDDAEMHLIHERAHAGISDPDACEIDDCPLMAPAPTDDPSRLARERDDAREFAGLTLNEGRWS